MPHKNKKVQFYEDRTNEVIKKNKLGHGTHAALNRAVVKATAISVIENLRSAVRTGQPTLNESIDHTEASLDAILDRIEASS